MVGTSERYGSAAEHVERFTMVDAKGRILLVIHFFKLFLHVSKFQLNYDCSNLLDMRYLQEQVEKAFCYKKLFWPFNVQTNCFSDLKIFANSRPSASNFKTFSRSQEQFFLTEGKNNFGNKIPLFSFLMVFHHLLSVSKINIQQSTRIWLCSCFALSNDIITSTNRKIMSLQKLNLFLRTFFFFKVLQS